MKTDSNISRGHVGNVRVKGGTCGGVDVTSHPKWLKMSFKDPPIVVDTR